MKDENGVNVPNAPVYVSDGPHLQYAKSSYAGIASFELKSGEYKVFSGLTKPQRDYVGHYASPEVKVDVSTDNASPVILVLQPVDENPSSLSSRTLRKMGLSDIAERYSD